MRRISRKKTLEAAKPIEENYKGNKLKSKKEHYIKKEQATKRERLAKKEYMQKENSRKINLEEANKLNLISKKAVRAYNEASEATGVPQTAYAEWENVVADMQVSTRLFFCKEIQRVSSHK